jgi:hypothetical protein
VAFSSVLSAEYENDLTPIVMRWRKCRRVYNEYPDKRAKWLAKLEEAYADATIDERLICPHRGAPLQGLQAVDGCVTCPLHGLKFDCRTGALSRKIKAKEARS